MKTLAAICIQRPVFAAMLILALTVIGTASYLGLGVDRFPAVDLPTIPTRRVVDAGFYDNYGVATAAAAFRRLYDLAIEHGRSYYLTYHRWATRAQVEAARPRFVEFLREKLQRDPEKRFQSDWYRQYRRMFAEQLPPSSGT